ncbi:hypothetical protein [Oribacterium sp. WCC10]|uniref:hypothetical protein n=1 Tax=Oribacterium sp. WCC10 TaxID=1855343 RepID=UPI0008ED6CA1|nr:hypothetical protein [Oribacterium sp. WCC10]SFG34142.1 hypothetical protein SAMN05216356_10647 [Oribacterium sp. WCC10]
MKFGKTRKALISAMAMSLMMSVPAMADWNYTLYGPIAVWTNSDTGEQTTVFAGQPAPDGTLAPDVTLTAEVSQERTDAASAVAAANAAADAAKAARGGNVSDTQLSAEQMVANTAAANANMNTNTVAVINSTASKASTLSNAELPMIQTGDQSAAVTSEITSGSFVGPDNSVTNRVSGSTGVTSETSSYTTNSGRLVTNAAAPDTSASTTSSGNSNSSSTTTGSAPVATGTSGSGSTGTPAAASQNTSQVSYEGTLPSTGAGNVNTYTTPGSV